MKKDVVLKEIKKELIISKKDFKDCFNRNPIVSKKEMLKYYRNNGKI